MRTIMILFLSFTLTQLAVGQIYYTYDTTGQLKAVRPCEPLTTKTTPSDSARVKGHGKRVHLVPLPASLPAPTVSLDNLPDFVGDHKEIYNGDDLRTMAPYMTSHFGDDGIGARRAIWSILYTGNPKGLLNASPVKNGGSGIGRDMQVFVDDYCKRHGLKSFPVERLYLSTDRDTTHVLPVVMMDDAAKTYHWDTPAKLAQGYVAGPDGATRKKENQHLVWQYVSNVLYVNDEGVTKGEHAGSLQPTRPTRTKAQGG